MATAKIDDFVTHYRQSGPLDGLPVLMLHGFPFTSESFWPQLDAPPPGVRLICPDHRGFGQSESRPGGAGMDALATDALRLLDVLGIRAAVVGGVSMGGYVSMALTRIDPSRVKALVLVDTHPLADDDAGKAKRETVAKDMEANGMSGAAQSMLPTLLAADAKPYVRARIDAMIRSVNPAAAAAAARGMAARDDSREILARFSGPALVVVGEHDSIAPPDRMKAMADLMPGSTFVTIPGAGHLTNVEQPQAFNEAFATFLARLSLA